MPLIDATPARCADPCEVIAFSGGYVAPVVEIGSGGSVEWSTLDVGHAQADVTNGAFCFTQNSHTGERVRFDLVDGGVEATTFRGTKTCEGARMLPDGSALLQYHCILHATMQGALVVSP